MALRYCLFSIIFVLIGCNAFTSMDSPTGDPQILSAARACFDQGNYTCAANYYGKLSLVSSDTATSEVMLEIFAQNGATSNVFINSILNYGSDGGKTITSLANALVATANEGTRLNIFHAYQDYASISDKKLQSVMRFIGSLTLFAEILAEEAGTTGKFLASDLVTDPKACLTAGLPFFTGCQKPNGKKIIDGTTILSLKTATDAQLSGAPTLNMLNTILIEVGNSLSEMESSSSVGSSTNTLVKNITQDGGNAIGLGTDSPIYRKALITYNIGAAL